MQYFQKKKRKKPINMHQTIQCTNGMAQYSSSIPLHWPMASSDFHYINQPNNTGLVDMVDAYFTNYNVTQTQSPSQT
jgi:hypothetical protein